MTPAFWLFLIVAIIVVALIVLYRKLRQMRPFGFDPARYRKAIAAFIGVGVMLANRHYGVDLVGTEPLFVDLALAILTLIAVEKTPNEAT